MSTFDDLGSIQAKEIWPGMHARVIQGAHVTLAVVELPPGGVVPEHRHANEQLGLCLTGSVTWTVGERTRELGPGGTWRLLAGMPHQVEAGPQGAVVVEGFSPIRADWDEAPAAPDAPPRWPEAQ
jgi:quercetin dioxygenase-like cupin family protein